MCHLWFVLCYLLFALLLLLSLLHFVFLTFHFVFLSVNFGSHDLLHQQHDVFVARGTAEIRATGTLTGVIGHFTRHTLGHCNSSSCKRCLRSKPESHCKQYKYSSQKNRPSKPIAKQTAMTRMYARSQAAWASNSPSLQMEPFLIMLVAMPQS